MVCKKELCVAAPLLRLRFFVFFLAKKKFLSKYVCSENPKKQEYSDKMSRAFPYETVYKVTFRQLHFDSETTTKC